MIFRKFWGKQLEKPLLKIRESLLTLNRSQTAITHRLTRIEQEMKMANRVSGLISPLSFWNLPATGICPFCRSTGVTHVTRYPGNLRGGIFEAALVCWCSRCGCGFVPEADRLLGDYYVNEYAKTNRRDRELEPSIYFSDAHREVSPALKRYFSRATDHLEMIRKANGVLGRVLDFGSGPGYFLHLSGAAEKYAIEFDERSKKYLDFLGAKLLNPESLEPESMDVIEASHVMEHLSSETVRETAETLVRALRPGGLLLAEVPNGGLSYLQIAHKHEPHTLFFTPEGLRSLFNIEGTSLVAATARSSVEIAPNPDAIYQPDSQDLFASCRRGGLTVVIRRHL